MMQCTTTIVFECGTIPKDGDWHVCRYDKDTSQWLFVAHGPGWRGITLDPGYIAYRLPEGPAGNFCTLSAELDQPEPVQEVALDEKTQQAVQDTVRKTKLENLQAYGRSKSTGVPFADVRALEYIKTYEYEKYRAIYLTLRALVDGTCPRCYETCTKGENRVDFRLSERQPGWVCNKCDLFISDEEARDIEKLYRRVLAANYDIFALWRSERKPEVHDESAGATGGGDRAV